MAKSGKSTEGPSYLKHNDKGQADSQKVPVSPGIMPIVFPECPIPAGNMGLSVGTRADDFSASPPLASLMLKVWAHVPWRVPEEGNTLKQCSLTYV